MNRIPIKAKAGERPIGYLEGGVFVQYCKGQSVFRDKVGKGMSEYCHFQLEALHCRTWRLIWRETKQVKEFPFAKIRPYGAETVKNLGEKQFFVPLADMTDTVPVLQRKFI